MTKTSFASIKELSAGGKYLQALDRISQVEAAGMISPEMLVWKARVLQLVEDGGSLDEVEKTLQAAIELDETCIPAVIELGWFHLNVRDDAKRALEYFQQALNLQRIANTELLEGLLKSMRELDLHDNLEDLRLRALHSLVDDRKLMDALNN